MPLTRTVSTFRARLGEIRAHANFVRGGLEIARVASRHLDRASLATDRRAQAEFVKYMATSASVRPDDIGAAVTLQAFAAFDWFARSILSRSASYVDDKTLTFSDLPRAVSQANISLSGRLLAMQTEAPKHLKVDVEGYCVRLGGCHPASESFHLNSDAFGLLLPNVDAAALSKGLKRLGFVLDWDDVGRSVALQREGKPEDGKSRGSLA